MTRKNNTLSSTRKILVFILSILMCLSLFFAAACKEDESTSSTYPDYFYTDKSDCEIDNPDFTYNTAHMEYSEFPKTSITGWDITKTATSNSGVIDVSDKGWEKLLYNLAKDNGVLSYVKALNGNFTDTDIREEMIEAFPDKYDDDKNKPTTSQVREYIAEKYFIVSDNTSGITAPFTNPRKHANATDNKVYMLNNYLSSDLSVGCEQTLTSAKTITIPAGEYAKISVFVKTENLNLSTSESGYGKSIGANIRIKNSFNNISQSDFGIFNITDTEWTEYTLYLKADSVFETKFSLVLGLGYNDYYAEGTAYFDDITVELLDKEEYLEEINNDSSLVQKYTLEYKKNDNTALQIEAKDYLDTKYYLYDVSLDLTDAGDNFTDVISFSNQSSNYYFTQYKDNNKNGNPKNLPKNEVFEYDLESGDFSDVAYGIDEGLKIQLKQPASVSVKLDNEGSNFTLQGESYTSITFFMKNKLNKLYAKDIVINVQDIYGGKTEERAAVATISELSDEWVKYNVVVKNNFDEELYTTPREFYLEVVIGPDSYQESIDKYALGTVYISNPIVATGKTYQYEDDDSKVETPNYTFYSLFTSNPTGEIALYTGNKNDYAGEPDESEVYNMNVASSDIGTIITKPATPKGYTGIDAQHYYITGNIQDSVLVNQNKNSGLINSKYVYSQDNGNYIWSESVRNALNHNDDENSVQPLMITPLKNGTDNYSYGYIGEKQSIYANSYGYVSVTLKVVDATAYIYLVDVSQKEKDVLKFDEFTVNTSRGQFNNLNETIAEKSLFFAVTPDMMGEDEWLTVEFYIGTGDTQKDFRVEMWNGERSNTNPLTSNGYVFVKSVNIETDSAFEEPKRLDDALSGTGTPLSNMVGQFENGNLLTYVRQLTDIEKAYNKDKNKQGANISYEPTYVWAQTDTMIYAIYNTIDPTEYDPYDFEPVEDETEEESLINRDPATFWMSFSSILLAVALAVAIAMLIIKNIIRKRKAAKIDAKSHYTVRSRVKKAPAPIEKTEKDESADDFEPIMEVDENEQTEDKEQTLDDYVYGDVQDFGENVNEEKTDD